MPIPHTPSGDEDQAPANRGADHRSNGKNDAPTSPIGLLTRLKPILTVLGGLLLLITGGVFGALYINGEQAVKLSSWLLAAAGLIVAFAFLLIVCLFILKHWLIQPLGQAAKRLMERIAAAAPQTRVVKNDEGGFTLSAPELDEELSQSLKNDAQTLLSAFFITRAYWRTLLILGTLIGSAVITAQLLVMIEQTERLAQQNDLIQQEGQLVSLQAQLDAINSKAELDLGEAQREYDEITTILFEGTSPAAQEYALVYQLPEAMLMSVTIVDPAWAPPAPRITEKDKSKQKRDVSYHPDTITLYPNLRRLAEQLLIFAKNDRLTEPGMGDLTGIEIPSGRVSTAIVRALHRFGVDRTNASMNLQTSEATPVDPTIPTCIWEIIFQEYGSVYPDWEIRARKYLLSETQGDTLALLEDRYGPGSEEFTGIDLRHIKQQQLVGVCLQGARLKEARLEGIDLHQAHLQRAILSGARIQNAMLFDAQLQGADLEKAAFEGARLSNAQLQAANFKKAQLLAAVLADADLQGANLRDAHLQGAFLGDTNLQGADLIGAQLQGAILRNAQLQGAALRGAQLQGADLQYAQVQGADFRDANFENGSLALFLNHRRAPYWTSNTGDKTFMFHGIVLPAANCSGIQTGEGFGLDRTDSYLLTLKLLQEEADIDNALVQGELQAVFWDTREEAEAAISSVLGEEFVKHLVPRQTRFHRARLKGVLVDQNTLDRMPKGVLDIPVAQAFQNAVTDPDKHTDWEWLDLPGIAEMFREQEVE